MSSRAQSLILEGGQSEVLTAAFQLVGDAEVGGAPKFSDDTLAKLKRSIVCRTYAPILLELSHLLVAASQTDGGYVMFLWDGAARSGAFRSRMQSACRSCGSNISISNGEVLITYADGEFGIVFSRMPVLAAMAELLVSTIGFDGLDDYVQTLNANMDRLKSVSEQSNTLSKIMYDYLKEHLPTVQAQKKLRGLVEFLGAALGDGFRASDIRDEDILSFWLEQTRDDITDAEDMNFKTYESVYRGFLHLRQAIDIGLAKESVKFADTIGADREFGEVEPADVEVLVATIDEDAHPFTGLTEGPAARVKFLNKREMATLDLFVESGVVAQSWALSLLRCESFGRGQTRIAQALRRKMKSSDLHDLIQNCAPQTYLEFREALSGLSEHVHKVMKASLYVLTEANREDDDRPENVVAFPGSQGAYAALNREGFRAENPEDDPDLIEAFQAASGILAKINTSLNSFLQRLETFPLAEENWDQQFKADQIVFTDRFYALYEGAKS